MSEATYTATGLTCGHCAAAVKSELLAADGVESVEVDVVADGESTITITSRKPLSRDAVSEALIEAGDYVLL